MIALPMTGVLLVAVLMLVAWAESVAESAPTTADAAKCAEERVVAR